MTKRITPAEAAAIIGQRGGQRKSERKRKAATQNAQSAGRTPKGYRIYRDNDGGRFEGEWLVEYIGDGKRTPVGEVFGYTSRRDAIDAAKAHRDKARRAQEAGE